MINNALAICSHFIEGPNFLKSTLSAKNQKVNSVCHNKNLQAQRSVRTNNQ